MGIVLPEATADLSPLGEPEEWTLIQRCAQLPAVVLQAAEQFEPHLLPHFLQEVATAFHTFYDRHRVLDPEAPERTAARLLLTRAAQIVLANGLKLLGIRAPERM
ncbi:MAG: hypothetical protein KatS3mg115_2028 [Candidatus Poribacteria bacterium]|nr:MAG: hypothetical protein KatS3mg115_2028 [Candidatus Poribacteria bacterium]